MTGGFAFDPAGEASWRRLEAAWRLERRLGRHAVVSPSVAVRTEVRRRLATLCPALTQVAPSVDTVAAINAAARAPAADARLPVVWIEAPADAPVATAWATALPQLNQAREMLGNGGPVFVVLAGPPGFDALVAQRAPDLWSVIRTPIVFGETLMHVGDAPRPFQWLHLSDIHMREEADWRADVVLDALVRDLPKLLEAAEVAPDAVFLTGDVAWSGQPKQYTAVQGFLRALFEALKLDPHTQLHLVPGNHDVDRKLVTSISQLAQKHLAALEGEALREAVGQILGNPKDVEGFGSRLTAWSQFVSHVCGPARGVSPSQPWRVDEVDLGAYTVGVAALCSAWACGPDEDKTGRILLGEHQVRAALSELKHCPVRVALLHHPLDWLHEAERNTVAELLRAEFHLVLHGHLHEARSLAVTGGAGTSLVSGAGAAYAGSNWKHGVQAGHFDPTTGAVSLRAWTYSPGDGGYWHVDPAIGRDAKENVQRYTLKPVVAAAAQRPSSESLRTRLCRSLGPLYDMTRFMGMAEHSTKPTARMTDLFVPLDFVRGEHDSEETELLSALTQKMVSSQAEPAARVVVLGDPGSGKSTLCRHIAVLAASAESPRVPLLIALRDMVRQGLWEGLLHFAATDLSARLSMRVDAAALEALCDEGQCLLLVDGLDEVVEPTQLERVREMLLGFAQRWPKVPMLATSRVVGYDRAALPPGLFEHLRLAPFTDAQLETFVDRWMAAMEPHDPVARAEGRGSLLSALEAEPRAKALARTPLFATLIALVHRAEARLPGDRARLYDMVVRTLLETWPAQRGQRFEPIDEGRQREVLERLALRLQEARGAGELEGINISRHDLVKLLTELLRERDWADRTAPEVEALVERWVQYLEAGTGLLVEASPGVFAPLHLSLFEYLAGRALFRRESAQGDAAVAAFVKRHLGERHWEETLLLMMGSEATRTSLIDAVCAMLCEEGTWNAWSFGVGLLREEVDLSPAWRTRVLEDAAHASLQTRTHAWDRIQAKIDDICRFSRRHGTALKLWLKHALRTWSEEQLLGIIALFNPAPNSVVAERLDKASIVISTLELSPNHPWGRWARSAANRSTWLRWHAEGSVVNSTWRALEALNVWMPVRAGTAILGLLRRGRWIGAKCQQSAAAMYQKDPTSGSYRTPAALALEFPHSSIKLDICVHAWGGSTTNSLSSLRVHPPYAHKPSPPDPRKLGITSTWAQVLESDIGHIILHDPADLWTDSEHFYIHSIHTLPPIPTTKFKQACQLLLQIGRIFSLNYLDNAGIQPPPTSILSTHSNQNHTPCLRTSTQSPWNSLERAIDFMSAQLEADRLITAFEAESFVGLLLGADGALPPNEAAHLATARVHNRWLYLYFDHLARQAPRSSEHQALLIALGLAQYQTTGMWPWGAWWHQTFAGEAPAHWLPAAMWHMCFAVGEPDNPAHEAAVDAAFARGADPNNPEAWPELAEALRQHRLHATPPEVLALYDHGDATGDEASGDA